MEIGAFFAAVAILIVNLWMFRGYIKSFIDRKACTTMITGVCEGQYSLAHINSGKKYTLFAYEYEGRRYSRVTSLDVMRKRSKQTFEKGISYPLYIDPNHPKQIRCTDRIYYVDEVFVLCYNLFFIILCALAIAEFLIDILPSLSGNM